MPAGNKPSKGPIEFPVSVKTTKCDIRTSSEIVKTKHGVVRVEVKHPASE